MKKVMFVVFGFFVGSVLLGTRVSAQETPTSQLYCEEAPQGTPHCDDLSFLNRRKNGADEVCCLPKIQKTGNTTQKGTRSGAKSGSGPNGIYICGDEGTSGMPRCTTPSPQPNEKCCWFVPTKGNPKGGIKGGAKGIAKVNVKPSNAKTQVAPTKEPAKTASVKATKATK